MDVNTVIDMNWLESATLADLKSAMRNPSQLAAVNALLQTPEGKAIASDMLNDPDYVPKPRDATPTPEEAAQIAADLAIANQQEAEATAAKLAEVAQPKAAEVVPPAPVEEKKKIVVDYQVTAEDGTPLGRPTHIEGWSYDEVIEKLKAAHVNAVRYAERVKKNKVTSIEARTQQKQAEEQVQKSEQEASVAVEEAAKEKDPIKLKNAISKVSKADRDAEIARETAKAQGAVIGNAWMADHKEDFQPCEANAKIIGDWLATNQLELSYENLELAFVANETRLAKPVPQAPVVETPAVAVANPPANASAVPAVATPSITAPPAASAEPVLPPATQPSQPVVAASESPSAAAPNAQPAARRPGVNGSLPPGTMSAQRPVAQQQPQTTTRAELLKDMKKMSSDELRKKLKNTEYVSKLRAAGIPVASNV
jgi:hypothetical protein